MAQSAKLQLDLYLDLAYRRKWWIIVPFCLALIGGGIVLKVFPKTYQATTLILLEPQSIPESFVKSTIVETVESQLQTIQQQIESRTNLERVIDEFRIDKSKFQDPFGKVRRILAEKLPFLGLEPLQAQPSRESERMERMVLVEKLRERISVNLGKQSKSSPRSGHQNLAFEVSFEWSDPEIIAPVVNSIVARFIENSLSSREEKAITTTDFFEKETAALRGELEAREKELEAFKKANMGMLPDQLQSNLSILNQLREQTLSLERRMDQDKQQLMFLKSQAAISQAERGAGAASGPVRPESKPAGGGKGGAALTNEELTSGSLAALEEQLGRLSSQYTEQHPDVVALKRRIEELRKEPARPGREPGAQGARGRTDFNVELQIAQLNARIESTQREIKEVEQQIEHYKERVERTPQVEMTLNKILRDYTMSKERYDSLLSKKMDAKMAEQMEKRRKGEQFRVLDPAVKPERPSKPDAKKIMLGALVLGLGLGFGCAYLREMLDPGFYDPGDLEDFTGVRVLVSLPDLNVRAK